MSTRKTYWDGHWHVMKDDGSVAGRCGPPTDDERAGWAAEAGRTVIVKMKKKALLKQGEPCPHCGKKQPFNTQSCRFCSRDFGEVEGDEEAEAPGPVAYLPRSGAKVYKVLTQRDEFFKSKFNPETLQTLINLHADDGWRVVSMTATDVGSFWGSFWAKGGGASRQELLVLLEKTVE